MSSMSSTSSASSSLRSGSLPRKVSGKRHNSFQGSGKPFRVVVLGQAAVGKTALVVRFVTRRFIWDYDPTLEMIYHHRCFYPGELSPVEFEILDTAGQEDLTEDKLKWADAYVIVYSIIDRCSFEEVTRLKFLITHVRKSSDPTILIIGNKNDMEDDRIVSTEEGSILAKNLNCSFAEVSVKEGYDGVVDAFDTLHNEYKIHKLSLLSDWLQNKRITFRKKNGKDKSDLDANPPKPRERVANYANTAVMFQPRPRLKKSVSLTTTSLVDKTP